MNYFIYLYFVLETPTLKIGGVTINLPFTSGLTNQQSSAFKEMASKFITEVKYSFYFVSVLLKQYILLCSETVFKQSDFASETRPYKKYYPLISVLSIRKHWYL